MKYDFTTIMDRHGMDAIAVDGLSEDGQGSPAKPKEGFDIIPMWVADMNFATVPTVQEAIAERVKHPAFGYFDPREEYFQEIIDWQTKRNGVEGLTAVFCLHYRRLQVRGMQCFCIARLISDLPEVSEIMDIRWFTVR